MNPAEQLARCELARYYGDLTDPQYMHSPETAERRLQEAVRKCWQHHTAFPAWIKDYVEKWKRDKTVA